MEEVHCCLICVGKRPGFLRRTLVGEMPYSAAPIYCHFESKFIVSNCDFDASFKYHKNPLLTSIKAEEPYLCLTQ